MKKRFKQVMASALAITTIITSLSGFASPVKSEAAGSGTLYAGYDNTYIIEDDGTVKQIGKFNDMTYTSVSGIANVKEILETNNTSFALLKDGTVKEKKGDTWTTVSGLTDVVKLYGKANSFHALLKDGTIKAWGNNSYNVLGLNTYPSNSTISVATNLTLLSGVKDIASGSLHTVFLMENGTVKIAGSNAWGAFGNGVMDENGYTTTPVTVPGITTAKKIYSTNQDIVVLLEDGTYVGWGINGAGQFGLGHSNAVLRPTLLSGYSNVKDVYASAGGFFILTNDGTVKTSGGNTFGQLGLGDISNKFSHVTVPNMKDVYKVFPSFYHTIVQLKDGSLYGAGYNVRIGLDTVGGNYQITNFTKIPGIVISVDTNPPVLTIGEYITTPTNKDITVTATTNKGTLNKTSHTFTENGSFEFIATDNEGNVTKKMVAITNIDKIAPVITIGNYDTSPTNKDISVTATTNEGTLNKTSYTFTENGSFEFIATDLAGNVTKKTVVITNIIKSGPIIEIAPYNTNPTNQDIIVTATTDKGTLNKTSHTFTENGSFEFIATDSLGNITKKIVTISNIDKVAPVITIGNYETAPTNKEITVTATTNEGSLNQTSHTFLTNGNFEFIATDLAGNVAKKTVTITNIDKTAPTVPVIIMNDNVMTIQHGTDANGIRETLYNLDGTGWVKYINPVTLPYGETIVTVKSIDQAGNESAIVSKTITLIDQEVEEQEKKLQEAIKAVEKAEETLNRIDLEHAKELVNALPESADKQELLDRIDAIEKLIEDIENNDLLELLELIQTYLNSAEANLSFDDLAIARELIYTLDEGQLKEDLLKEAQRIEDFIYLKLKEEIDKALDEEDLDTALDFVNSLPDSAEKEEIIKEIDEIKKELDKIADATKKVEEAELKRTKPYIDIAQKAVNELKHGSKKDELQDRLDKIVMDSELTEDEIKALKDATNKVKLAEAYKRDPYITNAQNAVNGLPECSEKVELQKRLDAIKSNDSSELDKAILEATNKVKLAEAYKREPYISNAQVLVDALPECPEKEALQERLNAVTGKVSDSTLANANKAVKTAEEKKTKSYILLAISAVDKVPNSVVEKVDLLVRVNNLKEAYNASLGQLDYLNALKYVELAEKNNSKYYFDKASKLVAELVESDEVLALQERLDAMSVIHYPSAEQIAINKATNYVVQAEKYDYEYYFNRALNAVNELHSCAEKDELLARLNTLK